MNNTMIPHDLLDDVMGEHENGPQILRAYLSIDEFGERTINVAIVHGISEQGATAQMLCVGDAAFMLTASIADRKEMPRRVRRRARRAAKMIWRTMDVIAKDVP